jgi:hypothetical protein
MLCGCIDAVALNKRGHIHVQHIGVHDPVECRKRRVGRNLSKLTNKIIFEPLQRANSGKVIWFHADAVGVSKKKT